MPVLVDVLLPLFGIIAAGAIAGRTVLGGTAAGPLNLFVYWVALPPLLFHGLATQRMEDILRWNFIAAFLGAAVVVHLCAVLAGRWAGREAGRQAGRQEQPGVPTMLGLRACFTNTGYMGIPLFLALFGSAGVLPAIIGTVLTSAILISIGVIGLEWSLRRGAGRGRAVWGLVMALSRNPFILSSVAGILWNVAGLPMPAPLATFCTQLGGAAGPVALFALGVFLAGQPWRRLPRDLAWIAPLKLVAQPLLAYGLAVTLFPLDPFWQGAAVLLAALPTGTLPFVLAQKYGLQEQPTAQTVLVTTLLSLPLLSILLLPDVGLFGPMGR